jgi:hypothetical protein
MNTTWQEKMRYQFDNFMGRGTASLIAGPDRRDGCPGFAHRHPPAGRRFTELLGGSLAEPDAHTRPRHDGWGYRLGLPFNHVHRHSERRVYYQHPDRRADQRHRCQVIEVNIILSAKRQAALECVEVVSDIRIVLYAGEIKYGLNVCTRGVLLRPADVVFPARGRTIHRDRAIVSGNDSLPSAPFICSGTPQAPFVRTARHTSHAVADAH